MIYTMLHIMNISTHGDIQSKFVLLHFPLTIKVECAIPDDKGDIQYNQNACSMNSAYLISICIL